MRRTSLAARMLGMCLMLGLALSAWAEGVIRLTTYPTITVADGRSTITVTAEVRNTQGDPVSDGTQVVFTTSLGSFLEPVARTAGGLARVVFTAGSTPGIAKIQASALSVGAVSTMDVEMVADRSMLSTAKDFIEVVAPKYLMYSMDQKIIGAAGVEQGVTVRYKDVEIIADDVQVTVPSYEVRARKAKLKFAGFEQDFQELYFRLNARTGYGTTNVEIPSYEIVGQGSSIRFVKTMKERFGVAQISAGGVKAPDQRVPDTMFEFADLLESTSTVSAKKAVAFPRGQIHFHKADLYVGTNRVMRLPLFQVNMYGSTPLVTDQVVNVYDNQLSLNYPYYLSLKPGETSVLRLRSGQRYGRNQGSIGGLFLDYELNWNKGDNSEGGLVVSGITRNDWSVGLRQYQRIDSRTIANIQLDFPSNKSLYGSANLSRYFDGFQLSLTANNSRSIRGKSYTSEQYSAVLEKDPIKVGSLPLRLFYGLTANYQKSNFFGNEATQEGVAARLRTQLLPIRLDSKSNLVGSMSFSQGTGSGKNKLSTLADLSLSRNFGDGVSLMLGYNYSDDGFTSALTGKHGITANALYDRGRLEFAGQLSKSLDVDRQSLFVDSSYKFGGPWRVSYQFTLDQYLGEQYREDIAMLSYRVGIREIGVSYSFRERRFGLQLFGTSLY